VRRWEDVASGNGDNRWEPVAASGRAGAEGECEGKTGHGVGNSLFVPLTGRLGEDKRDACSNARTVRETAFPASEAGMGAHGQLQVSRSVCGTPMGKHPYPFGHGRTRVVRFGRPIGDALTSNRIHL
jgi:hypothetical protein